MRTTIAFAVFALLAAMPARAVELKIFATGSMVGPLMIVGDDYTRATGNTLAFTFGTTGTVLGKIKSGEKADVIVISGDAADMLVKDGTLAAGTRHDVARSLYGAGVKAGAAVPDISTPEKFKAAVLAARSIGYPDPKLGAVSGIYLENLFQKLGIAEEAKKKAIVKPVGPEVAEAVAKGEIELGLAFVSEFTPNKGVKVVGPFPDAIQSPTLFAGGIAAASTHQTEARAFLAYVTGAEAATKLKAAGVEPAR